jgi:hypothetical protein
MPPVTLPEPFATRVEWTGEWAQWHDDSDPLPTEWDDEPPDVVTHVYTADQLIAAIADDRKLRGGE